MPLNVIIGVPALVLAVIVGVLARTLEDRFRKELADRKVAGKLQLETEYLRKRRWRWWVCYTLALIGIFALLPLSCYGGN